MSYAIGMPPLFFCGNMIYLVIKCKKSGKNCIKWQKKCGNFKKKGIILPQMNKLLILNVFIF